ncbi:Zn-dependent exopeptidase [Panus rudis PR-1116 ss-1]|nr:Zn-dependent exopeptidase [Panus rudis PR-1116 ss-1]
MRVATAAASISWLLVGKQSLLEIAQETCLSNHFYGTYGYDQHLFVIPQSCYNDLHYHRPLYVESLLGTAPLNNFNASTGDSMLLWIGREAIDDKLLHGAPGAQEYVEPAKPLFDILHQLWASSNAPGSDGQEVLSVNTPILAPGDLKWMGKASAIIKVHPSSQANVESIMHRHFKYRPVPSSPIPLIPVPSSSIDRVRDILQKVKFDPVVASLVNNISVPQMQRDIRYLTGEDEKSPIISRHSFSDGILVAADYIKDIIEMTGASCELKKFIPGFGPNVICTYNATEKTNEIVLISAHYDSRGSFGSTRAPGGDDDGSGTTAILAIARTIARKGVSFKKNVQLCLFAGEEQGLLGSNAYARELRRENANLTLMIQADMLAYHVPGEPPQLGLPDLIGTPEVSQLVSNLSAIYSPELTVGVTSACCSDHQSFHEQGFPATQVFERAGPIADPMYHNSGDVSDRPGYDLEQVKSIAKVQFATILHSAGFDVKDEDDEI